MNEEKKIEALNKLNSALEKFNEWNEKSDDRADFWEGDVNGMVGMLELLGFSVVRNAEGMFVDIR